MNYVQSYTSYLAKLQAANRLRELRQIPPEIIDFSSNDYLGLSRNNSVRQATLGYDLGATGSRLLSGNSQLFEEFERQISRDKNMPTSLIFNSGFAANMSALASLADENILGSRADIFFDKLNHASLYQGTLLAGIQPKRYKHLDYNDLELHLKKSTAKHKFIASETVFGMDGDIADLAALKFLAQKYDCFLYLDEAHATGLYGAKGYGLSCEFDLDPERSLVMGTFSKAIGSSGAFIASSKIICNFLLNHAKGFIYSTALSPMIIAASFAAWQIVPELVSERQHIFAMSNYIRKKLGLDKGATNIIPLIIGSETKTLERQNELLDQGFYLPAIRPPTVPPNSSRLRIAVSCWHSKEMVERLLTVISKYPA